jgi:hypothetical protein
LGGSVIAFTRLLDELTNERLISSALSGCTTILRSLIAAYHTCRRLWFATE